VRLMPEIPRDIDAQPVERPKIDPAKASMGARAVEGFADTVEQTAFYGAHQMAILQGAQDRVDASHLEAKYKGMYAKLKDQYALGLKGNYRDYDKQSQQDIEDIYKEIHSDPILKDNPRLQAIFASHLEDYKRDFQHSVNLHYAVALQHDGNVQLADHIHQLGQQASQIPAGAGRDAIFDKMSLIGLDYQKSHLANPEHVQKLIDEEKKNVQESYLYNLGKSQNPIDVHHAIDLIDAKDNKDTDKIDPEKKAIMRGQFAEHENRLNGLIEKKQTDLTVNAAVANAKENFSVGKFVNYDQALKQYETDKDFQRNIGLTDANGNLDRKKLEEGRKVLKELQTDQDNQVTGQILLESHKAWDKHKEINPDTIKLSDEFQGLSATGKEKLLDKVAHENHEILSLRTKIRSEAKAEEREFKKQSHDRYSELTDNVEKLLGMSKQDVDNEKVNLTNEDHKKLAREYEKLHTPGGITALSIKRNTIESALKESGFTKEQINKAKPAVDEYVGDETDPKRVKEKSIEALQHIYKTESHFFGQPTLEVKTRAEIKAEKAQPKNKESDLRSDLKAHGMNDNDIEDYIQRAKSKGKL